MGDFWARRLKVFICAALHLLTVSCLQIILAKSQHIDRLLVVEESDSRTRRIEDELCAMIAVIVSLQAANP